MGFGHPVFVDAGYRHSDIECRATVVLYLGAARKTLRWLTFTLGPTQDWRYTLPRSFQPGRGDEKLWLEDKAQKLLPRPNFGNQYRKSSQIASQRQTIGEACGLN